MPVAASGCRMRLQTPQTHAGGSIGLSHSVANPANAPVCNSPRLYWVACWKDDGIYQRFRNWATTVAAIGCSKWLQIPQTHASGSIGLSRVGANSSVNRGRARGGHLSRREALDCAARLSMRGEEVGTMTCGNEKREPPVVKAAPSRCGFARLPRVRCLTGAWLLSDRHAAAKWRRRDCCASAMRQLRVCHVATGRPLLDRRVAAK